MRRGEVDDAIRTTQGCGTQRGAVGIFARSGNTDLVFALGGDLRNQRSRFAAAQKKEIHAVLSSWFKHRLGGEDGEIPGVLDWRPVIEEKTVAQKIHNVKAEFNLTT